MSEEENKVVLSIFSGVYCNDEYAEQPYHCEIHLTAKDIERLKEMLSVCEKHKLATVSDHWQACWFDKRPAYTFDELPEKFICLDSYPDFEYDFSEEKDPMAEFNFGRIDTEMMDVSEYGIYVRGYGKHSGTKYESIGVGLKQILEELDKSEPTPRETYYFNESRRNDADDPLPSLEDLPKYLNDEDEGMKVYATEMLKRGGNNGSSN